MPITELHKKKRRKNLAILAILLGFMAMVWIITMIRIGGGSL